MTTTRRLAAILAADVAGYSAAMERDEEGTATAVRTLRREVIEPKLAEHQGRLIKTTGDGFLAEFSSPIAALKCALAIQQRPDESRGLRLRIGLNLGDVIIEEGGDLLGEGVNVAARLEGLAEPGGILISDKILREVEGKVDAGFDDRGDQQVKNITRPVRVYAVRISSAASAAFISSLDTNKPLPLPDKPSIAVLPFQNMSGDPEQEYFADGMVEDIITALSRFKSLFVIARNSSFTYKGKAVDIKQVGRELGVRYVLEGSVRNAAGRVRITGQLIDAATGVHIWADRFERDLTDVFALQDDVTVAVVSAIQPKLLQAEIAMAVRRRPESLTAYDLYLRALPSYYLTTREGLDEAIRLASRALELDPRFALVAALAAQCHQLKVVLGYASDPQFDRKEAVRFLRLALSLDDGDPDTLARACLASTFMVGDVESEIEMADRAVALNPNSFIAWYARGWVCRNATQPEEAVRSFERAIRTSPVDPALHLAFAAIGTSLIELGRFDEAVAAGKKARRQNPSHPVVYRCLASAFAHLGRDEEAREALDRLLELDPTFTITGFIDRGGQSTARLYIEGLRKAGLPE
jgi:adenylate cyclase